MRITTAYPVQSMDGRTARMSFYSNAQGTFTKERGGAPRRKASSPDQQRVQAFVTLATRNWDELSEDQRKAWDAYAAAHFPNTGAHGTLGPQGLATYVKANMIRQILGQGLLTDAPIEAPPSPLSDLTIQTASSNKDLKLLVTHGLAEVTGHVLLVKMTPALATLACHPKENDFRLVNGLAAASSVALGATGTVVSFDSVRYTIGDGQRYGVQARIVRVVDGMASAPIQRDTVRQIG